MLRASMLTDVEWLSAGQSDLIKKLGRHADKSIFLSTDKAKCEQGIPGRLRKIAIFSIKQEAGVRARWPEPRNVGILPTMILPGGMP